MSLKNLYIVLIIFTLLFFASNANSARPDHFQQVAQLPPGANNQAFGYSVAIADDTVAVGDPHDFQYGEDSGAVTIFQSNDAGNWVEVTCVTPLDAKPGLFFGRNIALSGDRLVVGAPFDNSFGSESGSLYIFERNQGGPDTWGQVIKITASDAQLYDNFGWAVSLDGDTVVASAYVNPPGGRVYIYERDAGSPGGWGEVAQLNPDPPGYGAAFGESLDLDGDLLVVGAYAGGDYAGYAYVFQRQPGASGWLRLTRFRAADTAPYDYFGYTVALDGWTVLSGAPGVGGLTGAAYIFTADPTDPETWTEQARLQGSDGAPGEYFGYELDISGDTAWVGAPWHASGAGAVFVYARHQGGPDQWGEVESLTGSDTGPDDAFGYWTSIDGDLAVAGAPGHVPNGSAYIFELDDTWLIYLPFVVR